MPDGFAAIYEVKHKTVYRELFHLFALEILITHDICGEKPLSMK